MNTLQKILCVLVVVSFIPAWAGEYIAVNSTITSISNTSGNQEQFTIWVSGGSGVCINTHIEFPRSAAGSEGVFERAYATALAAYMSGQVITVHDYGGGRCTHASYIRIGKR